MPGKLKGSAARKPSGNRRRETIYVAAAAMLFVAALAVGFLLHRGAPVADGTVKPAVAADLPIQYLDLPPIVARLNQDAAHRMRIVTVAATLEFAAKSERTALQYVSKAKVMLPFIMDSIMTGMQRLNPDAAQDAGRVSTFVLQRSNRVLQSHGVLATGLRVDDLVIQ